MNLYFFDAAILAALDHPPPFAIINVGGGRPSSMAVTENAHGLARYAQIAQADVQPYNNTEIQIGRAHV